MTEWSYHVDCENCGNTISAAARYCPDCGEEQKRAAEVLDEIRETTTSPVRTDGGQPVGGADSKQSPELGDRPDGIAGVLHDQKQRMNRARNHCFAEGYAVDDEAALEGYERAEHPIARKVRPIVQRVLNSGLPVGPMPLWLWWLIVVTVCTVSVAIIWTGGGGL